MTTTIVELFRQQVHGNAERPALKTKAGGRWVSKSFREWDETSRCISAALIDLGVRHGDRVGVMSGTRREWVEVSLGVTLCGAVTVPLYQQTTPDGVGHILGDSEAVVVFVEDPLQLEKLFSPSCAEALKNVRRVVYFDNRRKLDRPDGKGRIEVRLDDVLPRAERSKVMAYSELLEAGHRLLDRDATTVRERGDLVVPSDLATLMYTSGTTGAPKGVMLTHANFVFETAAVRELVGLTASDEQLLFLPLAHIFAQAMLVAAVRIGFCTSFAQSLTTVLDDAREVEPTFFGAVPRVYEKVHAGVMQKLRSESPVRRRVAQAALNVGRKVSEARIQGRTIGPILAAQHRFADLAVLEKIRHAFGKRLRFAISGGAPLAREVAEFFHAADVIVLEGYGLTETCAATHMNRIDNIRFGTVGQELPGCETKIAPEDGEVLVRGGNVMKGYFKLPEATAEVLDADGWFRTGDVGVIDKDGFLTITDRKKDIIVTAGGKNVAPQNIENLLKQQPMISQAVVIGDRRPYLVALLTLDDVALAAFAERESITGALHEDPRVTAKAAEAIRAVNEKLEPFQQIKKWSLLSRDLTIEAGEITPTLKVKRKAVSERFSDKIEALYR